MDSEVLEMRRLGRREAERSSGAKAGAVTTGVWTVDAVSSSTLSLSRGGISIEGVRMTTACSSVAAGDRVLVLTANGKTYAIGILA